MYIVQAALKENPSVETVMHAIREDTGQRCKITNIKVVRQFEDEKSYGTVVRGTVVNTVSA